MGVTAAAALILAVPASASHHPANAVNKNVSVTITRQAHDLLFAYTVERPVCPNETCFANYGLPYRLELWIDAPGKAHGVTNVPQLISAPRYCTAVSDQPLLTCNVPERDTNDPAKTLPLSSSIRIRVGTYQGAVAEIDVVGYSLDASYQEGVPVPTDCSAEEAEYNQQLLAVAGKEDEALAAVEELRKYARLGFVAHVLAGEHPVTVAKLHDQALADAIYALAQLKRADAVFGRAWANFQNCRPGQYKDAPSSSERAIVCSQDEREALIKRGEALGLRKIVPLVRKIVAERTAKKAARAARDVKRLKAQIAGEERRMKTYVKALRACE